MILRRKRSDLEHEEDDSLIVENSFSNHRSKKLYELRLK